MSFYTYYQAIPERCRLLERLRDEQGFCCLYTGLIRHGPGPSISTSWTRELDDVLNDFADGERFGSREEVDECLRDMTAELSEAVTVYPGLGERTAYIEKQHREIEEPLSQELRGRGSEANVKLMSELLYGGDALAPAFFDPSGSQLRLIPASKVAEGAKRLAGVELSEETHDISDYACEQFREWKSLIIEAARLGEAIIVFPTS
ncbi:MAG: hypothetical protein U0835_20785 [Isosphaeraceae bacterium]